MEKKNVWSDFSITSNDRTMIFRITLPLKYFDNIIFLNKVKQGNHENRCISMLIWHLPPHDMYVDNFKHASD